MGGRAKKERTMSKQKRVTLPVFSGTLEKVQDFLSVDEALNITSDDRIREYKQLYSELISEFKLILIDLSTIEEAIIQMRCMDPEVIKNNLSLFLSQNKYGKYVHAMSLFYTKYNEVKEQRCFIGNTSKYGSDLKVLANDPEFVNLCVEKLQSKMSAELLQTFLKLNHYEKLKEQKEFEMYEQGN